mmetsp:Transcript_10581/g.15899  ORF Transcript_10581/g.15899 Transcript_10581/m.15899 type:complete len:291 (-) Transcript_10581:92-964(-)
MAGRLHKKHQFFSRLLLFRGCMTAEEIQNEFLLQYEDEETDPEAMMHAVNKWHEHKQTAIQIDVHSWIDGVRYYGFRQMAAGDDVSQNSWNGLKAISKTVFPFLHLFFRSCLMNKGMTSNKAALSVNCAALLTLQGLLTLNEVKQVLNTLVENKYLCLMNGTDYDIDADTDDVFYVLGPRMFIDCRMFIESASEDINHCDCTLCSEIVICKGFRCKNERCPGVIHSKCAMGYFQTVNNGEYVCPSCQCNIDMSNMDGMSGFIELLAHPNDAVVTAEKLKQSKSPSSESHN